MISLAIFQAGTVVMGTFGIFSIGVYSSVGGLDDMVESEKE